MRWHEQTAEPEERTSDTRKKNSINFFLSFSSCVRPAMYTDVQMIYTPTSDYHLSLQNLRRPGPELGPELGPDCPSVPKHFHKIKKNNYNLGLIRSIVQTGAEIGPKSKLQSLTVSGIYE